VKIRQRFRVTDGIEVEDGQRSARERERKSMTTKRWRCWWPTTVKAAAVDSGDEVVAAVGGG
jgi:hypothetical protein